jgi:hypothetical protein
MVFNRDMQDEQDKGLQSKSMKAWSMVKTKTRLFGVGSILYILHILVKKVAGFDLIIVHQILSAANKAFAPCFDIFFEFFAFLCGQQSLCVPLRRTIS